MSCSICNDTGEFTVKQFDEEGIYIGDEVVKCDCKSNPPKKRVKGTGEVVIDADNNQ